MLFNSFDVPLSAQQTVATSLSFEFPTQLGHCWMPLCQRPESLVLIQRQVVRAMRVVQLPVALAHQHRPAKQQQAVGSQLVSLALARWALPRQAASV